MAQGKVIITAAVNGNRPDRAGIAVPVTPQEIADDAARCQDAGAAIVHFHARDVVSRRSTADTRVFCDIIARIRAKGDMLIEATTGVGPKLDPATGEPIIDPVTGLTIKPSDDERLGLLTLEPQRDLFSVAGGSVNMYNPVYADPVVFINSPYYIRRSIEIISAIENAVFQFEIFDLAFLSNMQRLIDQGLLARDSGRFWVNFCLGFGGLPATARHLSILRSEAEMLFPGVRWGALAPAQDHYSIAAVGAAMGADVIRTGYEDAYHLPDGELARSNAEMVEALVRIARDVGREVATPAEARAILNLAPTI